MSTLQPRITPVLLYRQGNGRQAGPQHIANLGEQTVPVRGRKPKPGDYPSVPDPATGRMD